MAGREADEPTGSLDSGTSDENLSLFGGLHRDGHTIIRFRMPPNSPIARADRSRCTNPQRRCGIGQEFASERHEVAPMSLLESLRIATHALRGIRLRSALTVLGIAVGVAAQASAVQFSPDQQNGATPEERSRIGENHAMNSE
ncbi:MULTISPECIES: hypothetical protein [unclassified Mesorhizobium]|uniref:hypothetical protein n=1 Tax=unclassified Mesorhizobium TaxID=325217 RepID=UPI00333DB8C6